MSKQHHHLTKNTFIVSLATLLSRILGFGRDLCLAVTLGARAEADAFFVAFRIPNLLRRLFAEGSLSLAFIPVFTQTKTKKNKEEAFVLARSVQIWLILILGIIILFGLIWTKPLIALIAPGFKNNPRIFQLTTSLTRICLPYILFISSVALYMGILNSFHHFLTPALAPCFLNLVLIAAAFTGYFLHLSISYSLAWGVLIAGIVQVISQIPALKKTGFNFRGQVKLFSPEIKKIFTLILPTVFGAAIYQINILFITLLASFLPHGSISYLYYADRLVQFPLGIFGIAIGTVALPAFSSLIAQKKWKELSLSLSSALNLNLFIILPASAGLIGLARPIISLLFQHGTFTALDVKATSLALMAYALGLPAFSLTKTLVSTFYAFEDSKTPVFAASLSLILNIILGLILMRFFKHAGLALAVSFSSWCNILFLSFKLSSKIPFSLNKKELIFAIMLSVIILFFTFWLQKFHTYSLISIPLIALFYLGIGKLFCINSANLIFSTFKQKYLR
ncbi:MAG: murein biosynthesis integral membrane protein MurJ [Desulfonauticus sp.]|nr:murein biosynthesis integral membrane protein MurJ [Desulfonauticus sp.]